MNYWKIINFFVLLVGIVVFLKPFFSRQHVDDYSPIGWLCFGIILVAVALVSILIQYLTGKF